MFLKQTNWTDVPFKKSELFLSFICSVITQWAQRHTSCYLQLPKPARARLSCVPPQCPPKSHSSDGLHLPVWENHLQPNKFSEDTFTTHWCNCASYLQLHRAARGAKLTECPLEHVRQPIFAEHCDFDKMPAELPLHSICLSAAIKGLKD